MTYELFLQFRELIEKALQKLEDKDAAMAAPIFPEWTNETFYEVGFKVRYHDVLYRVLLAHTSQSTWTPDAAPSLFTKILVNEESEEAANWEQPNSTNTYKKGDKVKFNNEIWVSIIDYNSWQPGVYGWKKE